MEHSLGSSWRVWLFLGCLEILESWHTIDRLGPLTNTNSGFISSFCDEENRALTPHSSLSSILSCASFVLISHFTSTTHPPFLHTTNQGQGSFILHKFQISHILKFSWTGIQSISWLRITEPSAEEKRRTESSPGFCWKESHKLTEQNMIFMFGLASIACQRIGFAGIFTVPGLSLCWPHI